MVERNYLIFLPYFLSDLIEYYTADSSPLISFKTRDKNLFYFYPSILVFSITYRLPCTIIWWSLIWPLVSIGYKQTQTKNRSEIEKKRRGIPVGNLIRLFVPLFTFKWRDELMYFFFRRDWRGSNPQLPPWQGGALTDWTTIPGKFGVQPKNYYYLFSLDFIRTS